MSRIRLTDPESGDPGPYQTTPASLSLQVGTRDDDPFSDICEEKLSFSICREWGPRRDATLPVALHTRGAGAEHVVRMLSNETVLPSGHLDHSFSQTANVGRTVSFSNLAAQRDWCGAVGPSNRVPSQSRLEWPGFKAASMKCTCYGCSRKPNILTSHKQDWHTLSRYITVLQTARKA